MNRSVFGSQCVVWYGAAGGLGAESARPTCAHPEFDSRSSRNE
jgi:hypothetical protein